MASWQSYVVNPMLRFMVKRKLARATSAVALRDSFKATMPSPPGANFSADTVGGVRGEWTRSAHSGPGKLLYLHGGGYSACSPLTHRPITGAYAIRGFQVFAPDYRLAPENPFPAALDDALAVYRAILEQTPAQDLVIGGDSAGGGLALATLLAAKTAGLPMPACALLFSPWTDLAGTGASVTTNARRECTLYAPKLIEAGELYLNGTDPKNPLASPLYGDLAGLPPLLIQVGEPEILRDDSTRLAERARAAGVEVDLTVWDNLPHVWQLNQVFLPEARHALDQAASFARAKLALSAAAA